MDRFHACERLLDIAVKIPRDKQDVIRDAFDRSERFEWGRMDKNATYAAYDRYSGVADKVRDVRSTAIASVEAPLSWALASASYEVLGSWSTDDDKGMRDFFFLPFFGIKSLADLEVFAAREAA